VFFRAGLLGGLTLGMRCLVYGYAAPAGNKPLALSGALEKKAQRRLAETSKFVAAVCTRGGLRPGQPGFDYCLHVRLMHAQVRALSLRDPRWNGRAWGHPINQHDMLATVLLFSVVFLGGLRILGLHVSSEEEEDFVHLWRLVGHYLGVDPTLLPQSAAQARREADFIRATQCPPDDDSRALVRALLNEPLRAARSERERRLAEAHLRFVRKMCAALLDEKTARGLDLETQDGASAVLRVAATMRFLEGIRLRVPKLDPLIQKAGARYWAVTANRGFDAASAFALPRALSGILRAG